MKIEDGFKGQRSIVLPKAIIDRTKENALYKTLHVTDIGYYPHAIGHYRKRNASLGQYILIYCVKGCGWYKLNGKTYQVNKNQYFILPPFQEHIYAADEMEPWTIYWLHFTGVLAKTLTLDTDAPLFFNTTIRSRIGDRMDLFEEIIHSLEMGYSKENLIYSTTVLIHFLGSIKYIGQYQNVKIKDEKTIDIVDETIHFMKENIERKLSLSEIANHVGYSISYFSTLFSNRTGFPITVYFNQLKIQKACQLLDMSNMKIKQVAYKVGIDDCYYFSRLFHQIIGMSPSEYKRQKKG